jgi:hypothetical protein
MDQFTSHHKVDHTSAFFGHNLRSFAQKFQHGNHQNFYEPGEDNPFVSQTQKWIIVALGDLSIENEFSEKHCLRAAMIKRETEYRFPSTEMDADVLIQKLKEIYTGIGSNHLFFISNHLVDNRHVIMTLSKHKNFVDFQNDVVEPLGESFRFSNISPSILDNVLNKTIHIPRSMEKIIDILRPENIKKPSQWLIVKA